MSSSSTPAASHQHAYLQYQAGLAVPFPCAISGCDSVFKTEKGMLAHVKRSHAVYLESTDSYKRDLCSIGGIYASYRVCLSCPCLIGPHRHQGRQPDCVNAQHPLSRLADFMISTTVAGARSQFAASPDPSDSISDNENADARVLSIQMPRTPPQDAGGGSSNSPLPAPNLSCSEWAPSTTGYLSSSLPGSCSILCVKTGVGCVRVLVKCVRA